MESGNWLASLAVTASGGDNTELLKGRRAGKSSGVNGVSTHTMRHTYRSWLDAVGTPIAVQQKLMRHADIRTTMNVYGDVVTDEMSEAHSKVVSLALNGAQTERRPS